MSRTHRSCSLLSTLACALVVLSASPAFAASVGDPEIKTDHTYFPGELEMSTPFRVLTHANKIPRGSIGAPANDRERLLKLFLWRCEHYTHMVSPMIYAQPGKIPDPVSDNPLQIDYDTMRQMFSYGWGLCGTNHGTMRAFADEQLWGQRRRQLAGDTGHEIYVDGAWRYVNTDQYTLHFLSNSATAHFASLDQVRTTAHRYIEWNPDLGGGYFMPQANTHGSYATYTGSVVPSIPYRSLQWRDYYENVWDIASSYSLYAEGYYTTPIVFRLKRGESFTRWLSPDGVVNDLGLAGRAWWGFNAGGSPSTPWSFVQNAPARDQTASGAEVSQAGGGQQYGNGCFDWQPSLASGEYADGLAEQTGTFVTGGSPVLRCTAAGSLTFEFFSPYTIAARAYTNNPAGKVDPAYTADSGAILYSTSSGTIGVEVSVDSGATWTSLGNLTPTFDFTNSVKGRNHYLLRLNFPVNAGLNTLRLRTLTMLSQAVYPNLKNGTSTINYAAGNQGALELNANLWTAASANSTTGYVQKVSDSGNINYVYYPAPSGTYALQSTNNQPISLVYKITMPPSLAAAGATFKQVFAALDSSIRIPQSGSHYGKIEISTTATGPWSSVANYAPPADNESSHVWTYGRTADGSALGGTTWYLKFTAYNDGYTTSVRYIRMNATYTLPTPTVPMDVTYYWNNGTNQTNTHTIPAGTTATSWTITTGTVASQQKVVFSVPSGGVVAPSITTQPSSTTVTAPATATFTVAASGTGLTYQWKKNGTDISLATSASYTTPATTTGDSGSLFTVVVTNAGGSVTSTPATLTVTAAGSPVITTQPSNATVTEPATATFTVVATGATSYQWKRNGTTIVGATSASYTTGATSVAGDNGAQYTVDVTNASGTVTSSIATLTVNAVAGPPVTVTFQEGAASYTGTSDTYLDAFNPASSYGTIDRVDANWYDPGTGVTETTLGLLKFDLSSIPAGATITSATLDLWLIRTNSISGSDTLVMDKVTSTWTEASTYGGGVPTSTASGVATPSLATVPNGSPLVPSHQYSITGLNTLVQGWYDTPASNFGVMFSFASNANFRFASSENATAGERPKLTVTYTTSGGSTPVITTQPANLTVTEPASATFTVVATGATSYQWTRNGTNIGGATSASYTLTPTSAGTDNGAVFAVKVTNASGTTTSSNATLTVNPAAAAPVITTQPSNLTVTEPASATFTVVATGATSYQWTRNGTNIGGATSASYTLTPTNAGTDNGAVFAVKVTNASGTTTSSNATLTVNPTAAAPVITTQPSSQTVTQPATATFTVVATGATSYQWKLNGTNIGGATSASYTTGATNTGMSGDVYTVAVTNATGTTNSSNAVLTVNPGGAAPVITAQPNNSTVTAPATATFTVTATGATSYQWQLNGTNIGGATSASYTTGVTNTGMTGNQYRVLVTNASGTTTSNNATLTVNPAAGNPITLSVSTATLAAPTGSTTTVSTTITLTNGSGAPITVTPSSIAPWLSGTTVVVPAGGTATLTILGNPTGLTGVNTGTLTLTNSSGGTQTMTVSFTVGTQAGIRKRSCAIGQSTSPDSLAWIFGLAALVTLTVVIRRRHA